MELAGKHIIVAGGTGFVGTSLALYLVEKECKVTVLSRLPMKKRAGLEYAQWDGRRTGDWCQLLEGAHAIVNLTGRSVNCVKTPETLDEIVRSRVEATRALGAAIRQVQRPPSVWVQLTTSHIFGDPPQLLCDEDSAYGIGWAPTVARAWEDAFHESVLPSQRTVILRPSIVLGASRGAGGGALDTLSYITKLGLGGRVGRGTQGISWIHEYDMTRLLARSLKDNTMRGAYIASSPNPVSQADFMKAMRKSLGRKVGLPATEWMVKLGAKYLFKTDPELILYGRYVWSKRLKDENFTFKYPEIDGALAEIFGR